MGEIEVGHIYKGFLGIVKVTAIYGDIIETSCFNKDGTLQEGPTHFKRDIIEDTWKLVPEENLKKELIKFALKSEGITIWGQKTLKL